MVDQDVLDILERAFPRPPPPSPPDEYAKAVALFYHTLIQQKITPDIAKELTIAYVAGG